jgi:hypothetical protein
MDDSFVIPVPNAVTGFESIFDMVNPNEVNPAEPDPEEPEVKAFDLTAMSTECCVGEYEVYGIYDLDIPDPIQVIDIMQDFEELYQSCNSDDLSEVSPVTIFTHVTELEEIYESKLKS